MPKKLEQLKSALEKKFGNEISFWPYEDGKICGTVKLHGGYELPFNCDFLSEGELHIAFGGVGYGFTADLIEEKTDDMVNKLLEKFNTWCRTAKEVLEKMESLEKRDFL